MSEPWRVEAFLHEHDGQLRVGLVATRKVGDQLENTSDVSVVANEADARHEARAFCAMLGVSDYSFVDQRKSAAA